MNILIIGANGRVGSQLAQTLAKQGHTVHAAARQANPDWQHGHIRHQPFDLTAPLADISQIMASVRPDVVYFTAGSRGKNLLQVDAFGAVKAMQAAKAGGVGRFILLSSVFALQPERWGEKFLANITDYNIAKYFADDWLVHRSGLDYTILQPGALQEGEADGKIQTDVAEPLANSIGNVAATLAALLHAPNTIGKVITMADGNTPIATALEAV
ncbi:NAD(P)H-binding protein [Uruburuella testudinis]|uniref:NAD(P)H-binding protein n=1 Tax=Uruburuella testudinis TaxID=1282863 RepID=A0ABY4DW22_9NEIS|nr:NAD(P)H-binding protein [Uruburuella testudinis]UOO83036.1 NAD(P)H-binding protein [Uruburuella testudinis]